MQTFWKGKGLTFPYLDQMDGLQKLHFIMDMTMEPNMLNKGLQGKRSTALQMLEVVLAFECKMIAFAKNIQCIYRYTASLIIERFS